LNREEVSQHEGKEESMHCSREARDWVALIKVCQALAGDAPLTTYAPHPAMAITYLVGAIFRPSSPTEVYSDNQPVYSPSGTVDLVPIDTLLGLYIPDERKIKIFITIPSPKCVNLKGLLS
jgi:hypothetical protein